MKRVVIFLLINFFLLNTAICYSQVNEQYTVLLNPGDTAAPIWVTNWQPRTEHIPDEFKSTSKYQVSAINPTGKTNPKGAFFPGLRGGNQLVIYTPNYGRYTRTNEYGREATVINGRVVSFNGANSYIPTGGYVISGHGEAKKWINENLIEGAYIKIDPETKTIESVITPHSHLYKVESRITEVKKTILDYKKNLPGYESKSAEKFYTSSFEKMDRAKFLLYKGDFKKAMGFLSSSLKEAEEAYYLSIPAVRDEFHGIWLRPVEKSPDEIAKTLKRLQKTGIKNIFLETYYQGYTIFPSETMQKYGLTAQREEFEGWNPLCYWIQEAHKRGMKVHIWFQAFYVGNEDVSKLTGHVLNVYPEWANVQKKNADKKTPQPSKSEHNGYFLDPANHQVREFLLSLINEIATNYDIDGLNIDYIRYPKSLTTKFPGYLETTWGYTEYARKEFLKKTGIDPLTLTRKHPLWQEWEQYRMDKVTELVSKIKTAVGENIEVSAVIFPDLKQTLVTKLQNWTEWTEKGYVDALTPLIMSSDAIRAGNSICEIRQLSGDCNLKVYPGLFEPFTSGTPVNLLHQIIAVRKSGASGVVLFDNAHLDDNFAEALRARIFRN